MTAFGNPQENYTEITFDVVMMSDDIPNTQLQLN